MSKANGTYKPLTLEVFRERLKEFYDAAEEAELKRRVPQEVKEFSEHLFYLQNKSAWNKMYEVVEDNVIKIIKLEEDTSSCEISAAENFIKEI